MSKIKFVPLYWPSSAGAETFRLRCAWFSGVSSLRSGSLADVSVLSCPRSSLFSVSSFLISSCSCWMTRARPRPVSMMLVHSAFLRYFLTLSLHRTAASILPILCCGPARFSIQISAVILYRRDYVAFHHLYSSEASGDKPSGTQVHVLFIACIKFLSFILFVCLY